MKITNRLLLAACLVLPLAACKKEEAAPVEVAQAALVAPDKSDEAGWKAYLSDVVLRNMGEIMQWASACNSPCNWAWAAAVAPIE